MKLYTVTRELKDAQDISVSLEQLIECMALAVWDVSDVMDDSERNGFSKYSRERIEKDVTAMFGVLDSMKHINEDLRALDEATEQEKRKEAVGRVLMTAPEHRQYLDEATLYYANVSMAEKNGCQEPKKVGEVIVE